MPTTHINEEEILKRYESLPQDLKDAMMGISTADAISEIGRKTNLNIEKMGALAEEVGLIILGFIPSANFISDIKTVLDIDAEKAAEIANEVNQHIFLPIRESLKRLHGASWSEGITKPPVKFEGQKVAEFKPAPPVPEIKPSGPVSAPEAKPQPPALPAPKEPMIIRPMGLPAPLPKEERFGAKEITMPPALLPTPTLPPAPARTVPTIPPIAQKIITPEIRPQEIKLPPSALPISEKEQEMPFSPFSYATPKPAFPAPTIPSAPKPIIPQQKIFVPAPQHQPSSDPYKEPLE
ncbi:MAG: hypothetical protein Q7R91_01605 [bacterium]|nr:hypothetical protein [bacterium]